MEDIFCSECGTKLDGAFCVNCGITSGHPSMLAGRYRIERELGRGVHGVVFLAQDTLLDRPVAIRHVSDWVTCHEERRSELASAVRRMSGLDDDHVVQVYDFLPDETPPTVVMEFVPGLALSKIVDQGSTTALATFSAVADVTDAIGALHSRSVVHGDVIPGNVLLTEDGLSKLGDIGFSPDFAGSALGYVSPEQLNGLPATSASDVYALGGLAYALSTGSAPFPTGDFSASLAARSPQVRLHDLHPATAALVATCLVTDPTQRISDASALSAEIDKLGTEHFGKDWRNSGRLALAGIAAGLAGFAAGSALLSGGATASGATQAVVAGATGLKIAAAVGAAVVVAGTAFVAVETITGTDPGAYTQSAVVQPSDSPQTAAPRPTPKPAGWTPAPRFRSTSVPSGFAAECFGGSRPRALRLVNGNAAIPGGGSVEIIDRPLVGRFTRGGADITLYAYTCNDSSRGYANIAAVSAGKVVPTKPTSVSKVVRSFAESAHGSLGNPDSMEFRLKGLTPTLSGSWAIRPSGELSATVAVKQNRAGRILFVATDHHTTFAPEIPQGVSYWTTNQSGLTRVEIVRDGDSLQLAQITQGEFNVACFDGKLTAGELDGSTSGGNDGPSMPKRYIELPYSVDYSWDGLDANNKYALLSIGNTGGLINVGATEGRKWNLGSGCES